MPAVGPRVPGPGVVLGGVGSKRCGLHRFRELDVDIESARRHDYVSIIRRGIEPTVDGGRDVVGRTVS